MNIKMIKILLKKELLDVFRDKKTVIMMLVIPVILYPAIFIGALQVSAAISSRMEEQIYKIAADTKNDDAFYSRLLLENNAADDSCHLEITDANDITDYKTALGNGDIDAFITGTKKDGKMCYDIYYLSSEANSEHAKGIILEIFDEYSKELTEEKLEALGLDSHAILAPVSYEEQDTASSEQSLGSILGSILPFMLVISLLMGTMYPAIDTTAGERERGTLETMLTLPVTNRELIVSKFLTVASIGIISAFLNILSMSGIAFYMYQIVDMQIDLQKFDATKFLPAILVGILAVLAFSLLISAVTMCVTSFARSYKEANNYITPLMLVIMLTGYIGFIPNVELTPTMAMAPVANICLLIKNMLVFKIDYMTVAIVLLSNIAYAVFAILFLSRIYDSESILFGDAKSGFQLFEKRSNLKKGGVPTMSDVWLVIALTIVLIIYAGSMLQLKFGLAGVLGTQIILLSVPLFLVVYTKKDIVQTYGFEKTGVSGYIGGIFLAVGMFLLNIVLSNWAAELFPESAANVTDTFSELMDGNFIFVLFVIAAAPTVCEEMLFRGLIFHSMKARYRVSTAMVCTAVIFGIYHMSLVKLPATSLLGFILCYAVWMTDSIYPAMMMHFINNALSVILSMYGDKFANTVFYKDELMLSDILLLAGAGLICLTIGSVVLTKTRKSEPRNRTGL